MPTPDKFMEAYNAWKRANDQHEEMMLAVMNGAPLDHEAMKAKTGELDCLHDDWMALARELDR